MQVRKRKIGFFSGLFGLLGAVLAIGCVCLALINVNASPVLVEQPQAARKQIETMMNALCAGEYDTLRDCLYGQPDLGLDREAEDPVGRLFWNALAESFVYEMGDEFHATDSGVALDVKISALDLSSVTENLRNRAQEEMERRIAQAENTDEIYDENHEYREAFVLAALYTAAEDALEQDAREVSWELTLNLVYENGQWWIMPEQDLLRAISGGILK